jgi:hypothetical protein
MSAHSSPDPESFERLLASAFVLQESLMGTFSLSDIVEARHLIATGKLDANGAMRLIADHARKVANATGVAVGLLKGNQLVYGAGSGSAVACVGQHVMATLSIPASREARGEILRVENTEADARIEAAICRQFGAQALLMLPIYHDRVVAGVLQVLFSEAHVFQDREVRTYRLMAEAIGDALSPAARLEYNQLKETTGTELPAIPKVAEQIASQTQNFLNHNASPTSNHAMCRPPGAAIAKPAELRSYRAKPIGDAIKIAHRSKRNFLYMRTCKVAGAGLAVVLVIAGWIAFSYRRPASPLASSKPVAADKDASRRPSASVLPKGAGEVARSTGVSTRENELDSTADDVTVRYLTSKPPLQRVQIRSSQVDYVSEDVTVRYFTPKTALQRVRVGDREVDYVSEDVTVRHFTLKPAVSLPR